MSAITVLSSVVHEQCGSLPVSVMLPSVSMVLHPVSPGRTDSAMVEPGAVSTMGTMTVARTFSVSVPVVMVGCAYVDDSNSQS